MIKTALYVGAAVAITYAFSYPYGKSVGRANLVQELQEDRATILKDGKQVDEKVYTADDSVLCSLLGGCVVSDNAQPE